MLCILTSFWVLRAPKNRSKHFFQPFFNLFCLFPSFFSDITAEINKKRLKINKKMWFCLLLKAGRHAKAGQLPEGVPPNCLFWVDYLEQLPINMLCFEDYHTRVLVIIKLGICVLYKTGKNSIFRIWKNLKFNMHKIEKQYPV